MADIIIHSYNLAGRSPPYTSAPGYFAYDSIGNLIIDAASAAGENKLGNNDPISYYDNQNNQIGGIGNLLVLPSPDYLTQVGVAGQIYGQLSATGNSTCLLYTSDAADE